jgi:hypothetical protein
MKSTNSNENNLTQENPNIVNDSKNEQFLNKKRNIIIISQDSSGSESSSSDSNNSSEKNYLEDQKAI